MFWPPRSASWPSRAFSCVCPYRSTPMPDVVKESQVQIRRLVLDVPGLDPAHARALASAIGEHLSRLGLDGSFGDMTISLDHDEGDLAARIVAAIRERLMS
jgi:hypothetical protein